MAYLTPKERKEKATFVVDGFQFETTIDFSDPVRIKTKFDYTEQKLCKAVASVIANFMLFTHPRLNGFLGIDTIKWLPVEKIVNKKFNVVYCPNPKFAVNALCKNNKPEFKTTIEEENEEKAKEYFARFYGMAKLLTIKEA